MKLNITIPAYNEEAVIIKSVEVLAGFLDQNNLSDATVVIADNASVDRTSVIGEELARRFANVEYLRFASRGKGLAVREGWVRYPADVLGFMDMDLATDLEAVPKAIELIQNGYDIVFGSRLAGGAEVGRSWLRSLVSRGYSLCLKLFLGFSGDASCGFKFISSKAARELLPLVKDNQFFFDTELLVLAKRKGHKLYELPVKWVENRQKGRKSTVRLVPTAIVYLRNIFSLRRRLKNKSPRDLTF